MSESNGDDSRTPKRSQVLAWALWDTGSAGVTAVVLTFVFSVYLTTAVGKGAPGGATPASWLGRALAISGVLVALLAPMIGVWVDDPRRRRITLTVLTGLVVALVSTMSLVRESPGYLWLGLALLGIGAACGDLASVPYNAMLRQLSTSRNSGRISGLGLTAAFIGSVGLLLVVMFGCIAGDGATRGFLHLPAADGMNIRIAMLVAAGWFVAFATPLLLTAHRLPTAVEAERRGHGALGGYRQLWRDLVAEWHRDRNLVYYLLAAAVFRDGLAGVTQFGGVLGVKAYGIDPAVVPIFGVAFCVVAAIGAVAGGFLDDRIGSKPVIIGSLSSILAAGLAMMLLSGPGAFWVTGLLLCLFIGPAQASARTLLLRLSSEGKEGVAFGLFTMTGRAVTFVAPLLYSIFVDQFHAERAGMGGLLLVVAVGLVALLMVRVPRRA
ncbi:MFS transporter [Candidatus Mycobacterium wuenschmannii]|uniref:MFS transporter n=1 Tax=Candidatus Mycobacterium wuenschmannii TaxID=3027808 RepID=A0ABY8W2E1_9MYCO|nr:MFS transporter [Candidatus Mycobacterium wuenschmannii]WIM89531.1 MFS transporter [Candidatus Mycobacterium wuenschmannii]